MARDSNKPIAIEVEASGYHFTCAITGAQLYVGQSGQVSFKGKDFFAWGPDVHQVKIVMLGTYKGATRYDLTIYSSLDYTSPYNRPGWTWGWKDGYDFEKMMAGRKQVRAQRKAAARQQPVIAGD